MKQQSDRIMMALSNAMRGVKPTECKNCKAHIFEEVEEDTEMACGNCGSLVLIKGERK